MIRSFVLSLAFFGIAAAVQASPKTDEHKKAIPIMLDGEELFAVGGSIGAFTAEERVASGEKRLQRIANDPFYSPDLITTEEENGQAVVLYRGEKVAIVTKADAALEKTTPDELASTRIQIIEQAIARYRERRLPRERTRNAIALALSSIFLAALLFLLQAAYKRLAAQLRSSVAWVDLIRKRLGIDEERLQAALGRGLGLLRILIGALLVLVYLEAAFSFVPITRGYAMSILSYILDPIQTLKVEFEARIGDLFFIAVTVIIMRYFLKILRWLMTSPGHEDWVPFKIEQEWALPFYKIVRLGVVALTAVVIYPYIPGSKSAAFEGIGVFFGALITFGASGTVSNLFGGLCLMFMRSFHMGDRVCVDDAVGDVVETNLLLTRLRTTKNEIVTIPNNKLLSGHLVNYSSLARTGKLILHTTVSIGYDAPWRKVHELLIDAAKKTAKVEQNPAPFVLQKDLGDFYVTYEINAFTNDANSMNTIYGELHQNIQDSFNEAGVEILSPHYRMVRDGNTTTIPASYRSRSYEAPSFRISEVSGKTVLADNGNAKTQK